MKRNKGFTALEVMIVVLIVGVLTATATPSFLSAKKASETKVCVSNLRQFHAAKDQWAMETAQPGNAEPSLEDLKPYLKRTSDCPGGGTYTLGQVQNTPSCSVGGTHHF